MTADGYFARLRNKLIALTTGQIALGLLSLFCLLLILRNPMVAIEHVSRGLRLCGKTVIPALFPFMVLSEMIVAGGLGQSIPAFLHKPIGRLFRVSPDGCCAILLGLLCGFPIGARAAIRSHEEGRITREEAERLLCFSNTPSSAFLITAVGVSLWGNSQFGTALYASVLTSAILTGILLARIHAPKSTPIPSDCHISTIHANANLFPSAIRSATRSILLVCAYVVFFSALVGTFNFMPGVQALPDAARACLFSLFELSTGMNAAATLVNPIQAALLCAFAAGWSGISVHCQILSICDKTSLSLRPYLLAKLLQSLLAPLLLSILMLCFPQILVRGGI